MSKLIDLTGQRFGRLTVIERAGSNSSRNVRWHCLCMCGNTVVVTGAKLRNGHTRSCGCLRKEIAIQKATKHLGRKTRLYSLWCAMKGRCLTPSSTGYQHYGGRGITVCDEWKNDFLTFQELALSNGYTDNLSLDRIDVNGNYEPANCRWVDTQTQSNNKRNNHLISFLGKTQTISQWGTELPVDAKTISLRIHRGWTVEEALTTPVGGKRRPNK